MEFLNDIDLDQELKTQLQQKIDEAMKAKVAEELESQTKGLKAKNDELLAEKKAIQRAREESDAKTRAEAEELAKKQNNFQQLYESQNE
jgi:rRNA-processing protein FCF1